VRYVLYIYIYIYIYDVSRLRVNNLYTIHLRKQYVVAPMDQEILSFLLLCAVCSRYALLIVFMLYADMLQTVWNGLDCRVDVCRITNGAHIERL
jgi:hypothetical protein